MYIKVAEYTCTRKGNVNTNVNGTRRKAVRKYIQFTVTCYRELLQNSGVVSAGECTAEQMLAGTSCYYITLQITIQQKSDDAVTCSWCTRVQMHGKTHATLK